MFYTAYIMSVQMQVIREHSNPGSLDSSMLESPIRLERQVKILSRLWGKAETFNKQDPHAYLQYYTEQCRNTWQSYGTNLAVRTHQNILDISERILAGDRRAELWQFVDESKNTWTKGLASSDAVNASIDLCVRLICMVDVGEVLNAFCGRERLHWTDECGTLRTFLQKKLPEAPYDEKESIKLERSFKVCNMVRIAGFQVVPTSNIRDHLRFTDNMKTVQVFHHVSFLLSHKGQSLFPVGFVEETLASLALLFPPGDKETAKWFKRQSWPGLERLDENVLRCARAEKKIEEYHYWGERIGDLKNEFDDSRPSNIQQWWNDRRDVSQWYPLWVAISLTVLFGLVQSIEGGLQVYKAYYPST